MSAFKPNLNLLEKLITDKRSGTSFQIVVHLGNYIYAMSQLREVSFTSGSSMSSLHPFYTESLYTMVANWFSIKGKKQSYILKHALTILGLDSALQPIDRILDSPVGNTTFRDVAREFRNSQATHQIFESTIQYQLAQKYSIDPGVLAELMQRFLDDMFENIVQLQGLVEVAFEEAEPELYQLLRGQGYFTSVRS